MEERKPEEGREEVLLIDTILSEEDPLLADCLRQSSESLAWRRFMLDKERQEKASKNQKAVGDGQ